MRHRVIAFVGMLVILGWTALAAAAGPRVILVLGNASFMDAQAVTRATGAEVIHDQDRVPLEEVAVLVLANIAYSNLPQAIQEGLVKYVNAGGALLISGGSQSFGSGGYQAVASIIPFEIRSKTDWHAIPFRPPIPVQPGHPILAGVTFLTVGAVNDMNWRPDSTEILQSPGGGGAGPTGLSAGGARVGGSYPYPLIAELRAGAGRVIGVAFDLNDFGRMRDLNLFIENTLRYLLASSRMGLG
jgi:hypothetical protein